MKLWLVSLNYSFCQSEDECSVSHVRFTQPERPRRGDKTQTKKTGALSRYLFSTGLLNILSITFLYTFIQNRFFTDLTRNLSLQVSRKPLFTDFLKPFLFRFTLNAKILFYGAKNNKYNKVLEYDFDILVSLISLQNRSDSHFFKTRVEFG